MILKIKMSLQHVGCGEMKVRKAKKEDSKVLEKLFSILYKPKLKWSEEKIKTEIKKGEKIYYILEIKNKIIGAIGLKFDDRKCKSSSLVISKENQNKGYGKKLLGFVEDLCKKKGIKKIWGYSLELYKAENFYENQGYKSKLIKKFWDNKDCYLLEKNLR